MLAVISLIIRVIDDLSQGYAIALLVVFTLLLFVFLFIIWRQPQKSNMKTFKIPLVPFFPMLSIFINIYLMMSLDAHTWYKFVIWFIIGLVVYFTYGARHSIENKKKLSWLPCFEVDTIEQSIEISKL